MTVLDTDTPHIAVLCRGARHKGSSRRIYFFKRVLLGSAHLSPVRRWSEGYMYGIDIVDTVDKEFGEWASACASVDAVAG